MTTRRTARARRGMLPNRLVAAPRHPSFTQGLRRLTALLFVGLMGSLLAFPAAARTGPLGNSIPDAVPMAGTAGERDPNGSGDDINELTTCRISGPGVVCEGSTNAYKAATVSGHPTYTWSITGRGSISGSATGQSVNILAGTPGTYTLKLKIVSGEHKYDCQMTVKVDGKSACSIEGPSDMCPNSTATFTGPDDVKGKYSWDVSGDATIEGPSDGQKVLVRSAAGCEGSFTISLNVLDESKCFGSCSRPIKVADTTPPDVKCPPDIALECGASIDPKNTGFPTSTDDCGSDNITTTFGDSRRSQSVVAGGCEPQPAIERTWTVKDACGNPTTCVQIISFVDKKPPIIKCPPDAQVECGASIDPKDTGTPTVTDDCGSDNITTTFGDSRRASVTAGLCESVSIIDRTWTAKDKCGNTATCVQVITIVDTTPPVITVCPPNIALQCGESTDPTHTGTPTATDNCGSANITTTFGDSRRGSSLVAGACEPQPAIERTWTVKDGCGNTTTCVQIISFVDTTPPDIKCPPDVKLECGASTDPKDTGTPTSTDNCGSDNITTTFGDSRRATATAGGCESVKIIDRTWTVKDKCGNTATCVQVLTIVDTTPPVITECPPDLELECGDSIDPIDTGSPAVTDNCGSEGITTTFGDSRRGSSLRLDNCAAETIERTWTVKDGCGNTTTCVQLITFVDKKPPVITCPANIKVASCDEIVKFSGSAIDDCAGKVPVVFQPAPGTKFPVGKTTVIATAQDPCGNQAQCSFTVEVPECGGKACPRSPGFWGQQCAQGSASKYTTAQLQQIAACIDDRVTLFQWSDDVAGFSATVNPPSPMNVRTQAARQFVALLANTCTGELGLIAKNGDKVMLPVGTPFSCTCLTSKTIGGLIAEVDQMLQSLAGQSLTSSVKSKYDALIKCMDDINNGRNIPTNCPCDAVATVSTAPMAGAEAVTMGTPGLGSVELYRPTPNPFDRTTLVAYAVSGTVSRSVDVGIYDVVGRRVRSLVSGVQEPGRHEVSWDGRSDTGNRVQEGVYFVHTVIGVERRSIRVVYLP